MTSDQRIIIHSLDRAAVIEAVTGKVATIVYNGQSHLAEFHFPDTSDIRETLLRIDQGLQCTAITLVECRSRLYRRIKGGGR